MKDFTEQEVKELLKICNGRTFIANCVINGINTYEEPMIGTTEKFYIGKEVEGEKLIGDDYPSFETYLKK